jgi:hypothetical protein
MTMTDVYPGTPPVEPSFLTVKNTRHALGDVCETVFWKLVKRKLLPVVHVGRKALVPYPAVKELAKRIEAGELAGPKGFKNHETAITNSIASRRRKARREKRRRRPQQ